MSLKNRNSHIIIWGETWLRSLTSLFQFYRARMAGSSSLNFLDIVIMLSLHSVLLPILHVNLSFELCYLSLIVFFSIIDRTMLFVFFRMMLNVVRVPIRSMSMWWLYVPSGLFVLFMFVNIFNFNIDSFTFIIIIRNLIQKITFTISVICFKNIFNFVLVVAGTSMTLRSF